jgi:hypothetical protein
MKPTLSAPSAPLRDPEMELQRNEAAHLGPIGLLALAILGPLLAIGYWLLAMPPAVRSWLAARRVCTWCSPRHRIGGNPFAKLETHGMCPLAKHRATAEARLSRNMSYRSYPSH